MFKKLPNPFKATMRQKFKKKNIDGQNSTLKTAKKRGTCSALQEGAFHPSHKGGYNPNKPY